MGIVLLSPTFKEGVINLPLLDIEFLPKNLDLSRYDYLIFTSKNSVKAIEKIAPSWKKIPALAVGEKTKKIVDDFGGQTVFTGNGYGESLFSFIKNQKKASFLFLRGEEVATDLRSSLQEFVDIDEAVIYKTLCRKQKVEIERGSKIIFTSPSTVRCFFAHYLWDKSFTAIAIGKTTQKEFPKHIEVFLPQKTSIDSCIALAKCF